MKLAIIYSTKYGSTKNVAEEISRNIVKSAQVFSTASVVSNIASYDAVILGFPIYAGSTTRDMRSFINRNWTVLKAKLIGVFVLCWDENRLADFLNRIFPEAVPESIIIQPVGGEIDPDKLMDVEKDIIFNLIGIKEKSTNISNEILSGFINNMNVQIQKIRDA